MRVGLLSDTHVPLPVKELPIAELTKAFRGVDLILHGGDIYSLSVLNDLEHIAPVLAARGDDDYGETARDERVQEMHIFELDGQVIWLVHQRPFLPIYSQDWWQSRTNSKQNEFGKPNIIIFGHEHRAVMETINGVLFVNPGSPTFLNYQHGLGTYGILDNDSGTPNVQILQL